MNNIKYKPYKSVSLANDRPPYPPIPSKYTNKVRFQRLPPSILNKNDYKNKLHFYKQHNSYKIILFDIFFLMIKSNFQETRRGVPPIFSFLGGV